jgi:hypothetical protein
LDELDYLKRLQQKFCLSSLEEKAVLGELPQKRAILVRDLAHVTTFPVYGKHFVEPEILFPHSG